MYDSTEELSHRVNSWVEKYQGMTMLCNFTCPVCNYNILLEFINTETKMVERMNECANKQIGVTAGVLKQFAGGESQLANLRQTHVCRICAWRSGADLL